MSKLGIDLIAVTGPTATGKTNVAVSLADRINGEVISADSRQVYRHMDIGTGKDLSEYTFNNKKIPYHLIDVCDPGEEYNLFRFQKDFLVVYRDIISRGKIPILCGGTGLYIDSIVRSYRMLAVPKNIPLREKLLTCSKEELIKTLKNYKKLHNNDDLQSSKRIIRAIEIEDYYQTNKFLLNDFPNLKSVIFGAYLHRDLNRKSITHRLKERLEYGLVEEVKYILSLPNMNRDKLEYYGLEYKFVCQYLHGDISYDQMFSKLNTAIHQFAKRQRTWFRRMEKQGVKINWFPADDSITSKLDYITNILEKYKI